MGDEVDGSSPGSVYRFAFFRYVKLDTCDYVVDLDTGKYTEFEPDFKKYVSFFEFQVIDYLLIVDWFL